MQRLEVSGAVRSIYGSLSVKRLSAVHYFILILTAILTLLIQPADRCDVTFPLDTPEALHAVYTNSSCQISFRSLRNKRNDYIFSITFPSFEGEVKPSVPCRRFAACKRSLNLSGSRNLGKITGHLSRACFHLSLLGSLASLRTYRQPAAKVGTSKGGGKQWQTTPKNLPRISVPEPYRSHDWDLFPASQASKAEY